MQDCEIKDFSLLPSGTNYRETAQNLREGLLAKAEPSSGSKVYTVSTGVGGQNVTFSHQQVSDLLCCARGINHLFPEVKTIIDVGGTSSRVIKTDKNGKVLNFIVSEKCATGSGYFLETVANVLRINIEDVGPLSLKSENPVTFTTGCAVFGESEAVSRVCEGFAKEDILSGVHRAIANKISALIYRIGLEEPCAISGGGALDIGLIKSIEEVIEIQLIVPQKPQFITALGAAMIAKEISEKGISIQ